MAHSIDTTLPEGAMLEASLCTIHKWIIRTWYIIVFDKSEYHQ